MTSAPFRRSAPGGSPAKPEPFTFSGQHPAQYERRSLAPVFGIGTAVPRTLLRPVDGPERDGAAEPKVPVPVPSPALFAARPAVRPDPVEESGVRFTHTSRAALRRFGLACPDAAALVDDPDIVTPDDQQTPGREVRYGGEYGFICTTEEADETATTWVLGVFERNHGDGRAPESLREVRRAQPRYAGAGTATGTMPTSFEEVVERVRDIDGWDVEPGRGKYPHVIVSADGKHRHPVAAGAHDFRAVRNFVGQLRASGLDVRRPAGGAKR